MGGDRGSKGERERGRERQGREGEMETWRERE